MQKGFLQKRDEQQPNRFSLQLGNRETIYCYWLMNLQSTSQSFKKKNRLMHLAAYSLQFSLNQGYNYSEWGNCSEEKSTTCPS